MADRIDLPAPAAPTVSVVVLAFRRVDVLRRCLRALAGHESVHPFEVVVVANGASRAVVDFLDQHVTGGVFVRPRVNLGFAGGCNRGVAAANGRYVVLLNDDATVQPGWLDNLVAGAEARPKAAVVGSLVLFPDGTVQDAGGMIGDDGMPAVVGRGAGRTDDVAREARPIDYASGCAVLVRRDAWDAAGGLDESFYPAYFEDVDLCLRLRQQGWETWLEPSAVVHHEESASTDLALKSLAWDWNKERFLARWGDGGEPPVEPVRTDDTDLLETEVRFLERATEVHEERLARMQRMLEDTRFQLSTLQSDHLGALQALEQQRAHGAWLEGRLEAERQRADDAEAALAAARAAAPYRQIDRVRGALRRVRRVARP
jgi:O-antigen biosynthesis protein